MERVFGGGHQGGQGEVRDTWEVHALVGLWTLRTLSVDRCSHQYKCPKSVDREGGDRAGVRTDTCSTVSTFSDATMSTSADTSCYTVVFEDSSESPSIQELRSGLEKGSDEVKFDTLRKIIVSTINGNTLVYWHA